MSISNVNKGCKALYEQLTTDNAAVVLVDHQVGLLTGIVDIDVLTLKHNSVALAKAAKVLGVPTIVTATAPDGMWGPVFPELLAARPDVDVLARTTVNPWDEPRFTQAVEALGRQKLIIAGVSTEVCLGLTAIRAVGLGYDAYYQLAPPDLPRERPGRAPSAPRRRAPKPAKRVCGRPGYNGRGAKHPKRPRGRDAAQAKTAQLPTGVT